MGLNLKKDFLILYYFYLRNSGSFSLCTLRSLDYKNYNKKQLINKYLNKQYKRHDQMNNIKTFYK